MVVDYLNFESRLYSFVLIVPACFGNLIIVTSHACDRSQPFQLPCNLRPEASILPAYGRAAHTGSREGVIRVQSESSACPRDQAVATSICLFLPPSN